MRILYICGDQGIPVFGRKGASTHIREMIAAFRRVGHEVALAAADLSGDRRADEDFETIALPSPKSKLLGIDGRYMLASRKARGVLARAAAEFRPDAVYERDALYFDAGQRLAEKLGKPRIIEVNVVLSKQLAGRLHFPKLALAKELRIIRESPAVSVISMVLGRELIEHGVPRDRIRPFGMAVDPRAFSPEAAGVGKRVELGWPASDVVLGYVGSMNTYHNPAWYMELAAKLLGEGANVRFLIVGGAESKVARFREQLAPHVAADRVRFVGSVPQRELPAWLAAMDAVVVPGADPVQSPTKVFEVGAMGRPLLLPSTEPVLELVGEDAPFVFPAGDRAAFEALVRRFIAEPRALDEPARKLRETVIGEHTWDRHAAKMVAWFEQLRPR